MTKTNLEIKRVIDRVWMQPSKIQLDVDTVKKLRRIALRLNREFVIQCNGYKNEFPRFYGYSDNTPNYNKWKAQAELDVIKSVKAEEKLYHELIVTLSPIDLQFFVQTDPRGGTLYISEEKLTDQNYHSKGVFVA